MSERSYRCETCGGRVSLPSGSRRFTLDDIRKNHDAVCPGVLHKKGPR